MRINERVRPILGLSLLAAGLGMVGVAAAPTALAGCNDSSGTVVCAQGDIRGTHAPPPEAPIQGAWGTWCSSGSCYPGYGGYGVALVP